MARLREFDEMTVVQKAAELFAINGFNGTSIDDLVKKTKLLRGSIYKAFGSKRNLFLLVLLQAQNDFKPTKQNLDLLTVALKEVAESDKEIRQICKQIIKKHDYDFVQLLGQNLITKIKEK